MLSWQVGRIRITRVPEIESLGGSRWIVPDTTSENLLQIPWLQPHFCDERGKARMSVHSFIVEAADGRRVLVDTCVGNDKPRPIQNFDRRNGPFLEDLRAAGFEPESMDCVVCTHLHVDHVGWNTRLDDGRWVPTFPRARYLFGRIEYEHWSASTDPHNRAILQDSVQPVLDAGLVDLVDADHVIGPGIQLLPTPGHTPGHASVLLEDGGQRALITGDFMHHPSQCAHPEWNSSADADPERAGRTRRAMLEQLAGTPTLVLGTHFAAPTGGRIVRDGTVYRFAVE
jgi:glyoxylase-like metal-dependent hydrolase (beta-lactamase superfamily II)